MLLRIAQWTVIVVSYGTLLMPQFPQLPTLCDLTSGVHSCTSTTVFPPTRLLSSHCPSHLCLCFAVSVFCLCQFLTVD